MPEEVKSVYVSDIDKAGVFKNLSPEQIPINGFQDANNVAFSEGRVSATIGWSAFVAFLLDSKIMYGIQIFFSGGAEYFLVFTKTQAYLYDPSTRTLSGIGGSFTGNDDQFFSSDQGFNNLFCVTNGIEAVQKWSGSGNLTALGGMTNCVAAANQTPPVSATGKIFRFFQSFAIIFNTIENGTVYTSRVRWSQFGLPQNWNVNGDGTGQAGVIDLTDTTDDIINVEYISNSLAIFKSHNIYVMSYIGAPLVFSFYRVVSGIGLLAERALAVLKDEIVFLGTDNFYEFDGITVRPLASDRIKNFFFSDLNPTYSGRVIAVNNIAEDEMQWWYPSLASTSGEIDSCIVFNYVTKTWSFRSGSMSAWFTYGAFIDYTWQTIPNLSWEDTAGAWNSSLSLANYPAFLLGDSTGAIYQYGGTYSQNGAAYDKMAVTRDHDMGKPDRIKRLIRVDVGVEKMQGGGTLNVYIGHRSNIGDDIVYSGPFAVSLLPGKNPVITCDISDVYFVLKFDNNGTQDEFSVLNYTLWYRESSLLKPQAA